jgi:hypothetical protein
MTIHEPMTALTDVLVAVVCLIPLAPQGGKQTKRGQLLARFFEGIMAKGNSLSSAPPLGGGGGSTPPFGNWKEFYFFLGISTLLGAFIHAFLPDHSGMAHLLAWLSMQIISGLATYFAERATIISFGFPKRWTLFCQLKYAFFAVAVIYAQHFSVVLVNNIVGILPVLFIHLLHPRRKPYHTWIGWGLVIQCVAGLVFALKISPSEFFDHKALAHVVMSVGVFLPRSLLKEGSLDMEAPSKSSPKGKT